MLELDDLILQRGAQSWHYHHTIPGGRILAVMGPSGGGKSTLLEAIGGFFPVNSGRIAWAGEDLSELPADRRPVATLFQHNNLFEHLSVGRNLRLGFHQGKPSKDQWQRVIEGAHELGVGAFFSRLPGELSGGQRQRVALLRTVLRPRPVLLLDEPFSALDDENRWRAGDWMRDQAKTAGKAVVFVSHNREDARRWGDELLEVPGPSRV